MSRKHLALKRVRQDYQLYLFLVPSLILILLYYYLPMYGVQIAFKDFKGALGISGSKWASPTPFIHFKRFFESYFFGELMVNTLVLSITQLILAFPSSIILALMLHHCTHRKLQKVVQTVSYAPYFISMVVFIGMLNLFFAKSGGLFNNLLQLFGIEPVYWLGELKYFRPIYVLSAIWKNTGYEAIIYIAALTNVSYDLHEAAIVDGASKFQRVWHVDLPCIMPTIITMLVLAFGRIMEVGFEKTLLMQNAINLEHSNIISTYVYTRGIQGGQFSFATAVSLFNSVINTSLILIANAVTRKISGNSIW